MDERKVSKARMSLVTNGYPRIRAPKLEHAAWQNGARPPLSHRTQPPRALTSRKVDGTRPSDQRWVSAGFSQGPAYKSRPGLFTRQGQIEVPGSGRPGPWDSKTSSSRAVSRDSQRLRRFSLAFPAARSPRSPTAHPADRASTPVVSLLPSRRTLALKPDCSTSRSRLDTHRFSLAFPPRSPTAQLRPLSFLPLFIFGARPFTKPTNSSPQLHLPLQATPPQPTGRGLSSREGKEEEEALGTPPPHEQ